MRPQCSGGIEPLVMMVVRGERKDGSVRSFYIVESEVGLRKRRGRLWI